MPRGADPEHEGAVEALVERGEREECVELSELSGLVQRMDLSEEEPL